MELHVCLSALPSKDELTCLSAVLRRSLDDEINGEILFPEAAELWFTFHLLSNSMFVFIELWLEFLCFGNNRLDRSPLPLPPLKQSLFFVLSVFGDGAVEELLIEVASDGY